MRNTLKLLGRCPRGGGEQEVEKVGEVRLKVSTWGRRFVDSQEAGEDPRVQRRPRVKEKGGMSQQTGRGSRDKWVMRK